LNLYKQKQVIYLVSWPFTQRDFRRFGIKNWITHGWKVKVFDITSFLHPRFWRLVNEDKLTCKFKELKNFRNINEVLSEINNIKKKVVFIDHIQFSSTEERIRKAARAHGVLIRMHLGLVPIPNVKYNILEIFSLISSPIILTNKLISFIKYKIIKFKESKYYPDYMVVGGKKSMLGINKKKTSIIKAHNFDYDFFIKKKKIKSKKKGNYLLFLDENLSYWIGFNFFKWKPPVTAENYYPAIDNALHEIAKSSKLNIKIAAHPSSNYETKKIKYKNTIIKNKTFRLVKDAYAVVAHSSTSLQYAIIMKKPIIFITTDEIQNTPKNKYFREAIPQFARELGKTVFNVDQLSREHNWKNYLNVDDKKYEKYIENFIKTKGSQEKLLWNIVIEHIEKDLFY
jgi:hypothetical protein